MSARGPVLVPGQPLPAAFTTPPLPQCGPGCYEYNGKILASIVGKPYRDGALVTVLGKDQGFSLPEPDATVTGTVIRLASQQVHLLISTVDNRPVPESSEEFTGVIRIADIRLTERDKIKIGECFRLGDTVKAKVLSLGDSRSYYLSTAANELGVVSALSEDGNPLVPVSYQEMEDAITGRIERRKVAKPEGV